jgi:hypothetical protein
MKSKEIPKWQENQDSLLGTVAHSYSPSHLGGKDRRLAGQGQLGIKR